MWHCVGLMWHCVDTVLVWCDTVLALCWADVTLCWNCVGLTLIFYVIGAFQKKNQAMRTHNQRLSSFRRSCCRASQGWWCGEISFWEACGNAKIVASAMCIAVGSTSSDNFASCTHEFIFVSDFVCGDWSRISSNSILASSKIWRQNDSSSRICH